jgi:hypothetical protein
MPALDFPNTPAVNDTFTNGIQTWKWDGISWNIIPSVGVGNAQVYVGSDAPATPIEGKLWWDTDDVSFIQPNLSPSGLTALSVGTLPSYLYGIAVENTDVDTTIAAPLTIGFRNLSSILRVGVAGGAAASGSQLGMSSSIYVANHSQAGSEQAPLYNVLRYDQGVGFAGSGTPGRGWLTDWTVHGAIATQQQLLSGVNLVMANYYNGQPSSQPSAGICLQAAAGIGGSLDSVHAAATRYPVGVGLAIVGTSDGGTLRGWETGIQIGGAGGGWNVTSSLVGKGITITNYDTFGIQIVAQTGAAARAIQVEASAGGVLIGESLAVDGSNYNDAKLAVARTNAAFGTNAGQPGQHAIMSFCTNSPAIDIGSMIGMGCNVGGAAVTIRAMAILAGRKANATSGNSDGYFQLATHVNGVGAVEQLRIGVGNLWTLADGASGGFAFGTTTGWKIGTATAQKLGFWNATPIVQPTTAVAASTFVAGTGAAVQDVSTFDGYTIAKVVKALRNVGILA